MYVDENELCDKNSQIGMYEVVAKKKDLADKNL